MKNIKLEFSEQDGATFFQLIINFFGNKYWFIKKDQIFDEKD
jgi:hypothetical protein